MTRIEMRQLRNVLVPVCGLLVVGCAAAPLCRGGLCGQKVAADRAMYIAPERVTDVLEVPSPGKVTVIDFFDVPCKPCIEAMPAWEALWQRMDRARSALVGISLDEDVDRPRRAVRDGKIQVTFPLLYDGRARALDEIYGVGFTRPVTVVTDDDGVVIFDSRHNAGDTTTAVEGLLNDRGLLR